tara:strand:+ start:229 stop:342 length:114 start_codon:yes stop_codon:yes gene_type:complete
MNDEQKQKLEDFMRWLDNFSIVMGTLVIIVVTALVWK